MSNIWLWIHGLEWRATIGNDENRLKMVDLLWAMLDTLEDDPNLALQYGSQSRRIGELLGEKWWVQMLNHWELQARFNFLADYNGTIELASRSAVEVRLPEYQGFPQRICLHEDLISAYVGQDPIGNRDLIEQALDYMESGVDPRVECYSCLHNLKLDFATLTCAPEEALQVAQRAANVAEKSSHHLTYIYTTMVELAYQLRDWENLLEWATLAESHARKAGWDHRIASNQLWLATYARHIGNTLQSGRLFQQATHRAATYGAFLGMGYYTALTAYHETGERLNDALQAQVILLKQLVGRAKPFDECTTRLEIIRLKQAIGSLIEEDIAALKRTTQELKAPQHILNKLDQLLAS